jgi:hypothetical protein
VQPFNSSILTLESVTFTSIDEIATVGTKLGFPALAVQASRRVGTPFIVVDVGQLETGEWIVIEVGDGQFAGLSQVPVLELWSRMSVISIGT